MYELIIVGGGPAGMTAAVYAARKKINTLLLTYNIGGQGLGTWLVENYMGYQFIGGHELMQKFEEQVKQFPTSVKVEVGRTVERLSKVNGRFEVETHDGETYQAKVVIVATGKSPRKLDVPGETKLLGRGVTYCAICDGPVFADLNVAVIGGGNSALEAANDMAKIAKRVHLISLSPLTADQILIDRLKNAGNVTILPEQEVLEIEGENRVQGIRIRELKSKQEKKLAVDGVFIEIGLIPNSGLAKELVAPNRLGEIQVDCGNQTGVPGLFGAGDVTSVPDKQIVIAAGEGAKAALQAHRYLQRFHD
jgi:alkyl hydroperoxide reductase subunit F